MQLKRLFLAITFLLNLLPATFAQEPTLLEHGRGVRTVEFSPVNASLLASAGEGHIIKLWNLKNTPRTHGYRQFDSIFSEWSVPCECQRWQNHQTLECSHSTEHCNPSGRDTLSLRCVFAWWAASCHRRLDTCKVMGRASPDGDSNTSARRVGSDGCLFTWRSTPCRWRCLQRWSWHRESLGCKQQTSCRYVRRRLGLTSGPVRLSMKHLWLILLR